MFLWGRARLATTRKALVIGKKRPQKKGGEGREWAGRGTSVLLGFGWEEEEDEADKRLPKMPKANENAPRRCCALAQRKCWQYKKEGGAHAAPPRSVLSLCHRRERERERLYNNNTPALAA